MQATLNEKYLLTDAAAGWGLSEFRNAGSKKSGKGRAVQSDSWVFKCYPENPVLAIRLSLETEGSDQLANAANLIEKIRYNIIIAGEDMPPVDTIELGRLRATYQTVAGNSNGAVPYYTMEIKANDWVATHDHDSNGLRGARLVFKKGDVFEGKWSVSCYPSTLGHLLLRILDETVRMHDEELDLDGLVSLYHETAIALLKILSVPNPDDVLYAELPEPEVIEEDEADELTQEEYEGAEEVNPQDFEPEPDEDIDEDPESSEEAV